MGPFETIELNAPGGIADYCARYAPWFRRYMADLPSPPVWDDAQLAAAAAAWGRAPGAGAIARQEPSGATSGWPRWPRTSAAQKPCRED